MAPVAQLIPVETFVDVICPSLTAQDVEEFVPLIKAKNEERKKEHHSVEFIVQHKFKCKNCKNKDQSKFQEDYKGGCVVCIECAVVVEDRVQHDGEWKRRFEGDAVDPSQHGPATNGRFSSSHNLRTNISEAPNTGMGAAYAGRGQHNLNAGAMSRTALLEAQKYIEMNLSSMQRVGKDERAQRTREGYKDKMKQDVFFLIEEHCATLQLPSRVKERAKDLFAGYRDMLEQLQKKEAVEAACILVAYREVTAAALAAAESAAATKAAAASSSSSSGASAASAAPSRKRARTQQDGEGAASTAGPAAQRTRTLSYNDLHPFECSKCKARFSAMRERKIHKLDCKGLDEEAGLRGL